MMWSFSVGRICLDFQLMRTVFSGTVGSRRSDAVLALYRLSTDVLPHNQSVGGCWEVAAMEIKKRIYGFRLKPLDWGELPVLLPA